LPALSLSKAIFVNYDYDFVTKYVYTIGMFQASKNASNVSNVRKFQYSKIK